MFQTENVQVFLQKATLGVDGEMRIAQATFYKTPITRDLAMEVSESIADRLFRKIGSEWKPCAEVNAVTFAVNVPSQNLEFYPHPEMKSAGGVIENVEILNLRALKLKSDSTDFTLAWDAKFEIVDKSITAALVVDALKQTVFLSMTPVVDKQHEYVGSDGSGWCGEHVGAAGGIEVTNVASQPESETAAGADAKAKAERIDEAKTINERAKKGRRGLSAVQG
jgi:hypothetical protein